MITQEELDKMDCDRLKVLLGCGLHGEEYRMVMREYLKKWKR